MEQLDFLSSWRIPLLVQETGFHGVSWSVQPSLAKSQLWSTSWKQFPGTCSTGLRENAVEDCLGGVFGRSDFAWGMHPSFCIQSTDRVSTTLQHWELQTLFLWFLTLTKTSQSKALIGSVGSPPEWRVVTPYLDQSWSSWLVMVIARLCFQGSSLPFRQWGWHHIQVEDLDHPAKPNKLTYNLYIMAIYDIYRKKGIGCSYDLSHCQEQPHQASNAMEDEARCKDLFVSECSKVSSVGTLNSVFPRTGLVLVRPRSVAHFTAHFTIDLSNPRCSKINQSKGLVALHGDVVMWFGDRHWFWGPTHPIHLSRQAWLPSSNRPGPYLSVPAAGPGPACHAMC